MCVPLPSRTTTLPLPCASAAFVVETVLLPCVAALCSFYSVPTMLRSCCVLDLILDQLVCVCVCAGGEIDFFGWSTGAPPGNYWNSAAWHWNDTAALFTKRYGEPKGLATVKGGIWTRTYEQVTFTVDCASLTAAAFTSDVSSWPSDTEEKRQPLRHIDRDQS